MSIEEGDCSGIVAWLLFFLGCIFQTGLPAPAACPRFRPLHLDVRRNRIPGIPSFYASKSGAKPYWGRDSRHGMFVWKTLARPG
jgi:hypothetical protein